MLMGHWSCTDHSCVSGWDFKKSAGLKTQFEKQSENFENLKK